jgi:DNA sulfur modification protein DndE
VSTRPARKRTRGAGASSVVVPPPEMVRLGSDVRDNLTTLKRRTGVMTSNVLCRWALCRSLAEPTAPTSPGGQDSAVEMTWKVFCGAAGDIYWWLLKTHCHQLAMQLDDPTLNAQLRAHIARGAAYLVGDITMKDASSLAALAVSGASQR